MKKYLLLIMLFSFYLTLYFFGNKTSKTMVEKDDIDISNEVVLSVNINFDNGINSNDLINLFEGYKDKYLVDNITINNELNDVRCSDIKNCVNDISMFGKKDYDINGFKIDKISFLAYKDSIIYFLDTNNLNYQLN